MLLASSVWFSDSPFLSDRRGGSSKTSAGSLNKILALQCSLKYVLQCSLKKKSPIHDSHVNNGSVVGLGQNAGTPIRSVRSSPTETAGCAM